MRALNAIELDQIGGGVSAEGVCRAYVSTMGGTVALAAGVGLTGGVGFIAGAGLYSFGWGIGSGLAEFICE